MSSAVVFTVIVARSWRSSSTSTDTLPPTSQLRCKNRRSHGRAPLWVDMGSTVRILAVQVWTLSIRCLISAASSAQADPSASGTAIRRWFRSDESPALAQSHADSPAVARLRRLTSLTGNRTRGISFRPPEVAGVEGVTRPLASPPGECRGRSLRGQCQTVPITRHGSRKKSRSGVTAGRECFCNPGPLSL